MPIDLNFEHGWVPRIAKSADGLTLHARDYEASGNKLPVVCLAGLTRNSIDFHQLALHLGSSGRRVIATDSRGRGKSDYDPDWSHYSLPVELADTLAMLASLGVSKAIFVGTSRGGLMTMLMAAVKPDLIAGAVLNDIGPVLDVSGLRRIQGYVGKMVVPPSYDDAIKILKFIANGQFAGISEEEWQYFVRTTWAESNGTLTVRYDLNIAKPMEGVDLNQPLPDLWPQFEALKNMPVLSMRGENSDLFSAATQAEMLQRHPACEAFIVPGQGHAPLLADQPSIDCIAAFIKKTDP